MLRWANPSWPGPSPGDGGDGCDGKVYFPTFLGAFVVAGATSHPMWFFDVFWKMFRVVDPLIRMVRVIK